MSVAEHPALRRDLVLRLARRKRDALGDRELTDAERRVAALVAQGQTNREVAARLFTTIRTVEAHLTQIYRKLGIRSDEDVLRLWAVAVEELRSRLDSGWPTASWR
jgi:DNA-binding CsgD family transcriptional regulator